MKRGAELAVMALVFALAAVVLRRRWGSSNRGEVIAVPYDRLRRLKR